MADRFVQQYAGPARPHHHRHFARGRGNRFEVHQRLGERDVDRLAPLGFLEQLAIEIASAEAMVAGLAPVARPGDDLHPEADQRADVRGDEAVGANDVDHAPAGRQRHADLGDARVAGAGRCVDRPAQLDLLAERYERQRIVGVIHRLVRPRRARRGGTPGRVEKLQRRGRAVDRCGTDFVRVGEGGRFAGNPAQAEARGAVIIGGLQPAVVEAERFADAVLEVELAVVAAAQMLRREVPGSFGIEAAIEEAARIGRRHADWPSAGPPSSTNRRSQ